MPESCIHPTMILPNGKKNQYPHIKIRFFFFLLICSKSNVLHHTQKKNSYPALVYIYGGPDSQTVSLRHTLS